MFRELVCPISNIRIDRNVVRTNGFVTTLLLVAYVVTGSPFIIIPLAADYLLRASMAAPTSPMTQFARGLARLARLPYRAMDKAPKVFASRIGLGFAVAASITYFVAPAASPWIAGSFAVFTALESLADLCVGCVVYTYVALPLFRVRDAALDVVAVTRGEESV